MCRSLGAADDADDLAQEALLDARLHLAALRDDAKLIPWVRRIAVRRTIRARRRRNLPLALDAPHGDPDFARIDLSVDERAALRRLTLRQRQLVALVYFAGYTQEEAADMLGISRGTVAKTLWESRSALAHALSDHAPRNGGGL